MAYCPSLAEAVWNKGSEIMNRTDNPARRSARINVKVLVILVGVIGVLGVAAVAGHYVRKRMMADASLEEGRELLQAEDWAGACKKLKFYLSKYPDNEEVLGQWADANLKVLPREQKYLYGAIAGYRRILRDHRPDDRELLERLAWLYSQVRDHNEVEYICERWLSTYPGDPEATLYLAKALVAGRKLDDARTQLISLVEGTGQADVEVYRLLSVLALQDGLESGGQEALEWLDRCVKEHPESAKAYVLRAHFLGVARAGNEAAIDDLEKAEALGTDDPLVYIVLCEEWIRWERPERAAGALERIEHVEPEVLAKYDIQPDDLELARYTWSGRLALLGGNQEELGTLADQALMQLEPTHRKAFLPLAVRLYLAANRLEDARAKADEYGEVLDQSHGAGSGSEEFLVLEAKLALAENKPFEVLSLLDGVVIRGAKDPVALKLLAWAYRETGEPQKALELIQQYVQRVPEDADAKLNLARACRFVDWERTLALATASGKLRKTLEADVLRIEARLRLAGDGTEGDRTIDTCRKELVALRKQAPANVDVRMLLASIAAADGRLDEAESELRQAVAACHDSLPAEMMLAGLYQRRGMWDEAMKVCEASVAGHPELAQPRLGLADLQASSGQWDEALETLEDAVQVLSGTERSTAQDALVRQLLLGDRRAEAVKIMEQLRVDRPDEADIRVRLLSLPEIRQDARQTQALVAELRAIEEQSRQMDQDDCARWRVEQALLWIEKLANNELVDRREQIVDMLTPCLQASRMSEKSVMGLGVLHERLGEISEAEDIYRRALARNPQAVILADRLLKVLQKQGRYADAEGLLQKSLEEMPGSSRALARHGLGIALGQENYDLAIRKLQDRVLSDPNDVTARTWLARLIYDQTQDLDHALSLLSEAEAIEPNALTTVASKVSILIEAGQEEEGFAILDSEIERRGDFVSYLLRARHHDALGNAEKAEPDYRRLVSFDKQGAAGHALLGRFLYSQGRLDEAIESWEAGLAVEPDNTAIKRVLTQVLISDPQHRKRGQAMLAELQSELPDDPELLRIEAEAQLDEGSAKARDSALVKLREVVQAAPQDVRAWRRLINLVRARGDLEEARTLVLQAVAANPNDVNLVLTRVGIESDLGNDRVARELVLAVRASHPDNVESCLLLLQLLLRHGDLESAVLLVNEATKLDPGSQAVQIARSQVLLAKGDTRQAVENLESYIDQEGGDQGIEAVLLLASLHVRLGELEEADRRLTQAEKIDTNRRETVAARLSWFVSQERFDELLSYLAALPEGQPDRPWCVLEGARLLTYSTDKPRLTEAMRLLKQVIEMDPGNVDSHLEIARINYRLGDRDAAKVAYRNLLKIDPGHPNALNDLAWLLADDGGTEALAEAEAMSSRGVRLHPNNPHMRDTRGVVLFKLGRLSEAQTELERCLKLAGPGVPTHAKALWHLAEVLKAMERPAEARARLEKALEIHERYQIFNDAERTVINEMLSSL